MVGGHQCQGCGKYYNKNDAKCHWCGVWAADKETQFTRRSS